MSAGPERLRPGLLLNGFIVENVTPLSNRQLTAYRLRHLATGAKLIHIFAANDSENLLAVAFPTPPSDNTGLPHILEHCVLAGSKSFPVKDPFVEMLKQSMATFLNAMTYSDKTVYPVASSVRADFINLAEVYLDAVFNPLLTSMTFKQEGVHVAVKNVQHPEKSDLFLTGIVYNEMKGEYSDIDSRIDRESTQGLFPDTFYGRDSGGEPGAMSSLAYSAFCEYYHKFYQPANAYLFAYGDMFTDELTAFIDSRLPNKTPILSAGSFDLKRQPRWRTPRHKIVYVPVEAADYQQQSGALTVSWLLGPINSLQKNLLFEILDRLLLGNANAPLRKALMDSHLGEDVIDAGYGGGEYESTFMVGLKGIDPSKHDDVMQILLSTLHNVATKGFSEDQIQAAFQQLQYDYREITSSYPVQLMSWIYDNWLYGRDPLGYLSAEKSLDRLQEKTLANPQLLTSLVSRYLCNNLHRLNIAFVPDANLLRLQDSQRKRLMQIYRDGLTDGEMQRLAEETAELIKLQRKPNTKAALSQLPRLRLGDVPKRPSIIPCCIEQEDGWQFIRNDAPSNGVNYLSVAFDLCGLPENLWPFLPVFVQMLGRTGTESADYLSLSERIAACTGGIHATTFAASKALDSNTANAYLTFHIKTLSDNYREGLTLASNILCSASFTDRQRVRDLILQSRMRAKSSVVPEGQRFAALMSSRTLSAVAAAEDLWYGLPELKLLHELAENIETRLDEICDKMLKIRRFLIHAMCCASFTGQKLDFEHTKEWLSLSFGNPRKPSGPAMPPISDGSGFREALSVVSDVAFCCMSLPVPGFSAPESLPLQVLAQLLTFDYLWENIRVQNGAYGAFCTYEHNSSVLQLSSYRDPAINTTLAVFAGVLKYVERKRWSDKEIERAAIACAKNDDMPVRASSATNLSLVRALTGLTDQIRTERRQELFCIRPDTVRSTAANVLSQHLKNANICVIAGQEQLELANTELVEPLSVSCLYS